MFGRCLQGVAGGAVIRPGRFWVAHCSFRKLQLAFRAAPFTAHFRHTPLLVEHEMIKYLKTGWRLYCALFWFWNGRLR
jgi:hypothetical protein